MYERMMQHYIKEDKLAPNLLIRFSARINKQINAIKDFNRGNIEGLSQWEDYLEGMKTYISRRTIAWDNTGKYIEWPNGAIFIPDLGYNVGYNIIIDSATKRDLVFIFRANLAPEDYGLKVPPTLQESKNVIHLTESHIRQIEKETLRRYLQL